MANYDLIGNIAIVKFPRKERIKQKKKFAEKFLKEHNNIKTILEKSDKIKGRLRFTSITLEITRKTNTRKLMTALLAAVRVW